LARRWGLYYHLCELALDLFLNVPLGLVAIVLALKMMPGLSADEKRPFDVVGFIATGLTMLCLVAGLEMFSQQHVSMVSAGATLSPLVCWRWCGVFITCAVRLRR
jgi:hypothetical protein